MFLIARTINMWNNSGFQRYLANTGWIFFGRIFSLIISFLLFSYIARYLGPANLGKLSYAQSFASIFAVFASFGIDHVLYRDLVRNKDQRQELLGSSLLIKLVLGLITFIITISTAIIAETESVIIFIIGIIAITNILQSFTIFSFYFDAIQRSKINSIGMIVINIVLAIIKILIIIFDKGIIFFASTIAIETLLNGIYFTIAYSLYFESITYLKIHIKIITKLLKESAPLLLASVSATIYSRIDQIMLKHYLDASAVGIYSVAVRISEIWNFIPGIVIASLFPALVNAQKNNEDIYHRRFARLLGGTFLVSSFFALIISLFSTLIIKIIAGPEYLSAKNALIIYVWGVVGAIVANVFHQLLVTEGWTKITFYTTTGGAIINIVLNIWLIPKFGVEGAAMATLIAYWAVPFSLLLFNKTRIKIKNIISSPGDEIRPQIPSL